MGIQPLIDRSAADSRVPYYRVDPFLRPPPIKDTNHWKRLYSSALGQTEVRQAFPLFSVDQEREKGLIKICATSLDDFFMVVVTIASSLIMSRA